MGQKSQLAMARMRLYRADRTKRRLGMDARKADTRNKIQLGGLIVKAGLAREPAAVLLGLLLEAAKTLSGPGAGLPSAAGAKRAKLRFLPQVEKRKDISAIPGLGLA